MCGTVREMCEGFMLFLCLSESAENGIVLFIYDHIYLWSWVYLSYICIFNCAEAK